MGVQHAVNVVARYFQMWNTGDTSAAAEIVAPDWIDHAHPEVTGPAMVVRSVEAIRAARPGLRFAIDAILGDGDRVAAIGSVGESRLVWVVRLENGLMAEMHTYREDAAARR
jgi:ketosteroid isomerase-like protein